MGDVADKHHPLTPEMPGAPLADLVEKAEVAGDGTLTPLIDGHYDKAGEDGDSDARMGAASPTGSTG